jgi:hypothetical protein
METMLDHIAIEVASPGSAVDLAERVCTRRPAAGRAARRFDGRARRRQSTGHLISVTRREGVMKRLLICTALFLGAEAAQAVEPATDDGNHFYYTIGVSSLLAKTADCSCDATWNLGALNGSLGWQPIKYLALEATGLAGVGDSTDQGLTLKFNSGYLASVIPMVPVSRWVSIYGRLGYVHTRLDLSSGGIDYGSSSGSNTAYGAGVQFLQPSGRTRLGGRVEVTHFSNRDHVRVDGVTLSFMQRF